VSSGASNPPLPERLRWELDRLSSAELDVDVAVEDELWTLRFDRWFDGAAHPFRLIFPPDHPEIAPRVYGPPALLPRHQDPERGHLCLVDNESNWWRTWYSAVELIRRLDALLRATEDGPEAVEALEAPIAEPLSGHLSFRDDLTVLVPDALLDDDLDGATEGSFRLRRVNERLFVVSALRDRDGQVLRTVEDPVLALTRDQGSVGGWVELAQSPTVAELRSALIQGSRRALLNRNTKSPKAKTRNRQRAKHTTRIIGVTFFEEGPAQGKRRRTWVFAETELGQGGGARWVKDKPIRAQAISQPQRQQRIPELVGLTDVRILLAGAGSLGSAVAVELAKAGAGRLDLFDGDVFEPGNAVRHVLPVTAAGRNKAEAVAEVCREINPFGKTHGIAGIIGHPNGDPAFVAELVADADLLIDTTGSHTVTRLLRRHASAVGIPVLTAALSMGGFGGRVVVLRAGGPCWDCFLLGQDTGAIPIPEEGPHHDVTPFGCSHPAASCAGFEITQLAAVTTRMAIQTLTAVPYPPLDHDWTILNFRPGGEAVTADYLEAHPGCPRSSHV